jgi:G:T-mismatch repair DNA endonuclease (very short patch repair protein)
MTRDARNIFDLEKIGWKVLVIWGCETKNIKNVADKILGFLASQ